MKTGHKILYHCGENSSHRLLLVRGGACDTWRSFVYDDATGEVIQRSSVGMPIDNAIHQAQLAALRNGVSPILHHQEHFAA